VQKGNVAASQRVMSQLNVKHNSASNWNDEKIVWGTNVAEEGKPELVNDEIVQGVVPDVTGYGLTDAVYLLKGLGLNVKATGQGTVSAQSLKEGHVIKKGETITLTLSPLKCKNQKKEEPKDTMSNVASAPKDSVKAGT
jgi:hypothetical protein